MLFWSYTPLRNQGKFWFLGIVPNTKRSSVFSIDSVRVPDMYNLVWDTTTQIDVFTYLTKTGCMGGGLINTICELIHPSYHLQILRSVKVMLAT